MAGKKIPMRMCTGCREMKPKTELVRVVKTTDGVVKLDVTGKQNGRGAYICKNTQCLNKAIKTNALSRAFETSVSSEVYTALSEELSKID